jgi:hypothetical protein
MVKEIKLKIPNMKEILKPESAHKPGYGMNTLGEFHKQNIWEQGSTPEDRNLLKKLGIKKGGKILSIATYYASWASFIKRLGTKVDYSDISSSMVKWAKKKYNKLFRKYITSNYELIPKKEKEYDWTFTFEACGGKRGLPIAYLRSLLNNRGGILVLLIRKETPEKMGSKFQQYPLIVKTLAKIYGCKFSVEIKKIKGHVKGKQSSVLEHQICKILTNEKARKTAKADLATLNYIRNKRKIIISDKDMLNSIKRLSKLTQIIDDKFTKNIVIK